MKVACDRCEVVSDKKKIKGWRNIVVFIPEEECHAGIGPMGFPAGSHYLLCDTCYDKMMDFIHTTAGINEGQKDR